MTSDARLDGSRWESIDERLIEFLEHRGIRFIRKSRAADSAMDMLVDPKSVESLPRGVLDFAGDAGLRVIRAICTGQTHCRFVLAGHDQSGRLRLLAVGFRAGRSVNGAPLLRLARRIARPEGLSVAFLGPDGAGKSTVLRRVGSNLGLAYRGTRAYHLRPYFGRGRHGGDGVAPTRVRPRSRFGSFLKLLWWWADYTIGTAIGVFPRLVATNLVLFDRYYLDLHVDPIRYRYGGPTWLARLVGNAIPEPDAYIVLHAPVALLAERKGELSDREAISQMDAWRTMASHSGRIHLVDASKSIDETVFRAETVLLEFLERRTLRRLGLPVRPAGSEPSSG